MATAPIPAFSRPYVISWNLTYRCNLACEHCYLDAGGKPKLETDEAFSDRGELSTDECKRVIDEIAAFAPESVTILTGGEQGLDLAGDVGVEAAIRSARLQDLVHQRLHGLRLARNGA